MHRKSLRKTAFFLLLFLLSPLFSCQREPGEVDREEPVRVEAVPVRQGDIARELRFTGSVEPSAEVRVFPKITAVIETLYVDQGDAVEKDDLLALLESEELKAHVAQAEAVLQNRRAQWAQMEIGTRAEEISQAKDLVAKAQVKLKDAENERERMQSLFLRGFIARRDLESADLALSIAQADLNTAEQKLALLVEGATPEDRQALLAQVRQAEAALALAKIQLSYARIASPIQGTVSRRFLDPGNLATPAQPLVAIVQMDFVKVIVFFPEEQIRFMVPGAKANLTVSAHPGRVFQGAIDRVSPTLDPSTRMFSAEIKVRNEKSLLRPGMFARVVFSVDPRFNALLVPKEAVFFLEEYREGPDFGPGKTHRAAYVFVAKDGWAHRRKVSLGHESGPIVEITEGLEAAEQVVTRGHHLLSHGNRIRVVNGEGGKG